MKNTLTIFCLLFALTVTAQNHQKVSLGISHSPSLIFEWENINIEGNFFVGGEVLSLGVNAKTNSDFKESEISLIAKTKILKPNEKIEGSLLAGTGFTLDQINEDLYGEKHREYFIVYGFQFSYEIAPDWSLYYYLKRQHQDEQDIIGGIGATIRLK